MEDDALPDELITDLHTLRTKHKLKHLFLIVPLTDNSIQLALSNISQEQVWMICDEIAKRFHHQKKPLNG